MAPAYKAGLKDIEILNDELANRMFYQAIPNILSLNGKAFLEMSHCKTTLLLLQL